MSSVSASHRWTRWIPIGLMLLVGALFLGAPTGGEFYWSEAPRNALNGVFVKDLLKAMPWHNPIGFAYRYYAQYPALTILFYPPLFYILAAPFYALLGVSHGTVLVVVMLHYMAFAWGAWRLFAFWFKGSRAAAAAVMLVAAPEVAFWGRQVMLEIPAFAFLIWSAVCFTSYRRQANARMLYWAVVLLLLAMYTKISVGFMALSFIGTLLFERRTALLKDRVVWIAGGMAILGVVPLVLLTVNFGQVNVQSVVGVPDTVVSRGSFGGWIWYLAQMPGQLGWPVCVTALLGICDLAVRRGRTSDAPSGDWRRCDLLFWTLWALCGYLFFSAIALREARHSVFILPPVVMAACVFLSRLPAWGRPRLARIAWCLLPVAVIWQTMFLRPVYFVKGYAETVDYVVRHAEPHTRVLFSGSRDGAFIFNMRARDDRRDIWVVRADKLLLNVTVDRSLGVKEKPVTEAELSDQINRLGIQYVVVQPGFWSDLAVMQRFERLLHSAQFEEVARFNTIANYDARDKQLVVYRNRVPVSGVTSEITIDLPIIRRSISVMP